MKCTTTVTCLYKNGAATAASCLFNGRTNKPADKIEHGFCQGERAEIYKVVKDGVRSHMKRKGKEKGGGETPGCSCSIVKPFCL